MKLALIVFTHFQALSDYQDLRADLPCYLEQEQTWVGSPLPVCN